MFIHAKAHQGGEGVSGSLAGGAMRGVVYTRLPVPIAAACR
jgi:hypothetical protein